MLIAACLGVTVLHVPRTTNIILFWVDGPRLVDSHISFVGRDVTTEFWQHMSRQCIAKSRGDVCQVLMAGDGKQYISSTLVCEHIGNIQYLGWGGCGSGEVECVAVELFEFLKSQRPPMYVLFETK